MFSARNENSHHKKVLPLIFSRMFENELSKIHGYAEEEKNNCSQK